jgi:thiol-disulfide isomerase/thioredoxin/tetratricopeptide (TPR) repeat protein
MLLTWLLTASAADLDAGWYLAYTGRPEAAATLAATALRDDPDSVDAHRLYVWARSAGLREGPILEDQYRAWVSAGGGEPAALGLAWQLSWRNREPGAWCGELAELTTPLPDDPVNRYWAQRVQLEVSPLCGGDPQALIDDLLELGDNVALARPFALELAMGKGLVDSVLQEEIAITLATDPWALVSTLALWAGAQGPRLEETQEAVIAVAQAQLESETPHLIWAAIQVLGASGDLEGVGRVSDRLADLDPTARRAPPHATETVSWLGRPLPVHTQLELEAVYEASNTPDPATAIKQLKRAGSKLGVDGLGRQAWQLELSAAYARQGKDKKAFRALREAWAAYPDNADVGNQFAYTAAMRGVALDTALLAIDYALAKPIRWDPRGDHLAPDYGTWLMASSAERGAWLDTRGWVLHAMGRDREAALALEQALLMVGGDNSVQHLHLGMVYAALAKDALALDHLGRGLAQGRSEEPRLTAEARATAERLFDASHWAPGGLDGWLVALGDDPQPTTMRPVQTPVLGGPDDGAAFPDLAYFSDGDPTFLSSVAGWKVVDLWATWCGPCLEAMPHLEELAVDWAPRGVTFVALSVDEDPATVAAWLDEHGPQGMVQGWIGLAGLDELGLDGIPAIFVVDPEGVVRASLRGWAGPQDARLDLILADLVSETPVEPPQSGDE